MAVSTEYLAKMQRAVRIKTATADVTAELKDLVEEARADLISLGVLATKANDETDSLILGAVRCFVRWKMAPDAATAAANREDYETSKDELRRKRDYISYAITFSVTASGSPASDAEITFNGETKETGADGTAVFYYVSEGTNQEYTVEMDRYVTQTVDLDVTASATVSVALIAG
jgi:hypothetical protein